MARRSSAELVHALVAEYAPGTPLGWHRDVPDFETIVGVSLGGRATLKFRPYPDEPATRKVVQLEVAPRSIYKMADEARWDWQHSVAPRMNYGGRLLPYSQELIADEHARLLTSLEYSFGTALGDQAMRA